MTKRTLATAFALLSITGPLWAAEDPQNTPPLDKLLGTPVNTEAEHVLSSVASKYDQELSSTPASVTVITAEEIDRYGWTSLDQMLQSVPGFYLTNDRTFVTLGIRGIGRPTDFNTRILVMLDGHVLHDGVVGDTPVGSDLAIDPRSIERIEIVRGPGSALYGSHAMYGVINIITKQADAVDGISITGTAGSPERRGTALRYGGTLESGLQLTGSANWQDTAGANFYLPEYDAPETNNGITRGHDFERLYSVAFGLRKNNLRLSATRQARTKGIANGWYDTMFNSDSQITTARDLVAANYHRNFGANKTLEVRGDWGRTTEHGLWLYPSLIERDKLLSVRKGAEARLTWDIRANQRLTVGTEYTDVSRAEYRFAVGDHVTQLVHPYDARSYYAEYEFHPSSRFGFVAGVRHDNFSATADSTNPRAALLFTPNPSTTLKLLYGTAFRSPSIFETYYADSAGAWTAHPELRPERTRTMELEWEERLSPELFFVASAYHIAVADLIEQEPSEITPELYWYDNESGVKSRGFEAKIDLRRRNGLWGYFSYSFAHAGDSGTRLNNSPQHLLKGGISSSPWAPAHFGLEAVFETSRLMRDGAKTDPFLLLNGTASRELDDRLRLELSVRNLLDTKYSHPAGPTLRPRAIPQDRRTLTLNLTYTR